MPLRPYLRKVHYYETDQMGIVHHSNYIRWLEEARINWLEQLSISYSEMEKAGVGSAVTSAHCEYKSVVCFGDVIEIECRLLLLTPARMTVGYTLHDKETGALRAVGETGHCFVNRGGRPVSLKKHRPDYFEIMLPHAESTAAKKKA